MAINQRTSTASADDQTNRAILAELQEDARLSIAELGRRVGLSSPAVARETPEVTECHRVTGDDCYVMFARVRDVEHLEEVIDAFAVEGQTISAIMQSSPVPRRGVPLT